MFERFTERARRVIILAREEAGRFRHDFVGTEHILLGLIRDGEGHRDGGPPASRASSRDRQEPRSSGPWPDSRRRSRSARCRSRRRPSGCWSCRIEEARQLGHNYIGTEHLLLGVMKEGQSIAAKILESLGARLDEVRQETLALLGRPVLPAAEEAHARPRSWTSSPAT